MTKTEKRKIISSLLDEVEKATEYQEKENKLELVIKEIYNPGYNLENFKRVSIVVNELITDFITHKGEKSYLMLSKAGLLACIEWSVLSDK